MDGPMPRTPPPPAAVAQFRPEPVTIGMTGFKRLSDRSHNTIYEDLSHGRYDSILIGARRFILLPTYFAYIDRLRLGQQRDPAETRAAIRAYRKSLLNSRGAVNAARARKAIGRNRDAAGAERGAATAVAVLARPQV
jgi:hypothetical protein